MKKMMIIGLLIFSSLNASAYAPNGVEIRNFVNHGLITGITEYFDIHAYCRECPMDRGRQCQQFQVQNGDSAINLIPGDAQLIDEGILIRCLR